MFVFVIIHVQVYDTTLFAHPSMFLEGDGTENDLAQGANNGLMVNIGFKL